MHVISKFAGAAMLAALATVLVLPVNSLNAAGGEAAIKERRALTKEVIGKNWKPIKAYAKDGKGTPAEIAKHAEEITAAAKKITGLFPKGTGRGDYSDKETRALPAIWKDWNDFEKAAEALGAESAKLTKIAMEGNKDAITKQIGAMGKKGCGTCHKPFRGAKAK